MPQEELPDLKPLVSSMRIVLYALMLGVFVFGGVGVYLVNFAGKGPLAPMNHLLSWIAVGIGAVVLLMQAFIPGTIVAATRQRLARTTELAEISGLIAGYRSKLIVGATLCEGAAFMALQAYLLEGDVWLLPLTVLFVLLIAARVPSAAGLASWIDTQHELIEAMRVDTGAASAN
jgi:hypothetical protein